MPNIASDTLPPTRKQLAYLRKLAQRAGQTFTTPRTRFEASAEIRRLQAIRSTGFTFAEPYRIDGHTLRYLPGTRPVRLRYTRSQNDVVRYDALQVAWLTTHLTEGDTAVDIGAHYGVYSILMAAKCGQTGHVVAFEPDPSCARSASEKPQSQSRHQTTHGRSLRVLRQIGEATLFSRGGNSQSSLARSAVEFSADAQIRRNSSASRHSRFLFVGAQPAGAPLRENRCGGSGNPYFERCEDRFFRATRT